MGGSTATVTYGGRHWSLAAGAELTVGRSSSCAVRLPDDEHLSRRAVLLTVLDDCVLVRNTSTSKPIVLRPPAGEDRVVAPGSATTSLPYRMFGIVLVGSAGDESVHVDASAITPQQAADAGVTRSGDTFTSPEFTAAQHRVVVALCRPLLVSSGAAARPATYAEIGERLALSPQYVRNVIKTVREGLTGYGIPGLAAEERLAPNDDFRLPLARWALWSGWVSAADLDEDDRGR